MIKHFNKSLFLGGISLVSLFFVCAGFHNAPLHPLVGVETLVLPALEKEHAQVKVHVNVMDGKESKACFGHDLPSRGVIPLKFSLENNSAQTYSLCASSVDLPRVEASAIAMKITKSSFPRSMAYRVAGFFFWPFAIPGTIDGIRVMIHHRQVKKDILAKSLKDEVLAPYSTFNRVLFVDEKEFKENFEVTLIEMDSLEPTTFKINCN